MPSSTTMHLDAVGVDRLFEGVVEPCDVAYVDLFLKNRDVDSKLVSINNTEEISYDETVEAYVLTKAHELKYKGEVVWKVETSQNEQCRSKCELTNNGHQMVVTIESIVGGAVDEGTYCNQTEKDVGGESSWTRKFDTESLIRASATAYQKCAVEEEVGFQNKIMNKLHQLQVAVVGKSRPSSTASSPAPTSVEMATPAPAVDEVTTATEPIVVAVAPSEPIIPEIVADDNRDDDNHDGTNGPIETTPPTQDDVEKRNDIATSRSVISSESTESSVRLNENEGNHDINKYGAAAGGSHPAQLMQLKEDDEELSTEQKKKTTSASFGFFDIDFDLFKQFMS